MTATATAGFPPRIEPAWSFEILHDARPSPERRRTRGGTLPAPLRARHGGPLEFELPVDRPLLVANFVSTLDGVVALDRLGNSGGREISGGFEPDRFLMGLLRATADAVLVGAGTVRASGTGAWTPARVHHASADAFAAWRRVLGLERPVPTTLVATASGDLDLEHFDLAESGTTVVVLTTTEGARRLRGQPGRDGIEVTALADGPDLPVEAIVAYLRRSGFELVLSEGGPRLFAELLGSSAVDELFLTLAPQLAGRSDRMQRLALVEGVSFPAAVAPWSRLRTVRRAGDHLFLRYDLSRPSQEGAS
jgi:riboflavin biosynthesis pyrimidine reductase